MAQSVGRRGWPLYRSGAVEPPSWLAQVRSWGVVRQAVGVEQLEGFDLVVVTEPQQARADWLTDATLGALQARDIRVVAHIPLLLAQSLDEPQSPSITPPGLRPSSWYVDAVDRIRAVNASVWDGCYLDGVADALGLPDGLDAVIELVSIARSVSRGGIVIIQSVPVTAVTEAADLVGVMQPLDHP